MSTTSTPEMNVVNVTYAQSGNSVNTNELGMREMQARVWEERGAHNLLIKAPPASGKSRALMFVALDKLFNQGRRKVIVAVPERSIGGSFDDTDLKTHGFFANWHVKPENNLCKPASAQSLVKQFVAFMESKDAVLVCTHATLRFAFEAISPEDFNGCVLAIDEFHHVSADLDNNRLGNLLRTVMDKSDVHVIAMTGSYFRGDSIPVLAPEDEARFTPVTFNYYDQLNGYRYLKSLGIGHHFYQGPYTESVGEALHLDRKTIIHIPSVNSGDSTKDKFEEVGQIMDAIGEVQDADEHGIYSVRRRDTGEILRVADLVDDTDQKRRAEVLHYLTTVASKEREAVDIIIALGMAKEGFDWPYAEDALTIGYRASLTEIIQIIGRVTRDCEGKEHAQFTNLIAEPDASTDDVTVAVNNMLKAITASLLMEQVLAPNFAFKAKQEGDSNKDTEHGVVKIKGFKEPSTERVRRLIDTDLNDLKATVLQDEKFAKAAAGGLDPETTNKVLVPRIIRERYPALSEKEVEEVRQHVVADSVIKNGDIREIGDERFIRMADKFVKIEDLSINLIDSVNPFQKAFEVMSKNVTPKVLRTIQDAITASKVEVTEEEALQMVPKIKSFVAMHRRKPNPRSDDPAERRLGEILLWLQAKKRQFKAHQGEGKH
ncbi:ATP-dependent helicase [Corynebacterium uropygiale]|uniref:ATP-dependent helicase n=1 Tax=Corynebacterium uropygiale TaxID=1775911 RepID=A0A9X1QPX7_9CORY|nr:DEAD/DEAH box helicase [Corynebacterium uropygiale]MCF4005593.1 ATP-dependent helicase [Corynebacterium uropygiale]